MQGCDVDVERTSLLLRDDSVHTLLRLCWCLCDRVRVHIGLWLCWSSNFLLNSLCSLNPLLIDNDLLLLEQQFGVQVHLLVHCVQRLDHLTRDYAIQDAV